MSSSIDDLIQANRTELVTGPVMLIILKFYVLNVNVSICKLLRCPLNMHSYWSKPVIHKALGLNSRSFNEEKPTIQWMKLISAVCNVQWHDRGANSRDGKTNENKFKKTSTTAKQKQGQKNKVLLLKLLARTYRDHFAFSCWHGNEHRQQVWFPFAFLVEQKSWSLST